MTGTRHDPRPLPGAATEETSLRDRLEAAQSAVRERLDQPIARAAKLAELFPVRVWRQIGRAHV